MPEDEVSTDTQPTTNLANNTRKDFLQPILEGLHNLILDDQEEQPLWCLTEEDLQGDKGDTTSEDSEPSKTLKHPQTPFSMHKNPLYVKTSPMATQEKTNANRGHPEGSKPQQPFEAKGSYLNTGKSTESTTPGANQNSFNIFSGGATSQMPASPFNPFATCGPTSDIGQTNLFESQQAPTNQKTPSNSSNPTNQSGSTPVTNPTTGGGYNPTLFGMPQYGNLGINAGMPNFGYGWNGAFPYTPYPTPGYLPNNMMQYPLPGNAFGFGGSFTNPFPNNGTPCMPNSNNNNNTSNNGKVTIVMEVAETTIMVIMGMVVMVVTITGAVVMVAIPTMGVT
eukprot:Gb_38489 [translate_table: standard]